VDACVWCSTGKMPTNAQALLATGGATACTAGNQNDCNFFDITQDNICYMCNSPSHTAANDGSCTAVGNNHLAFCRKNGTGNNGTSCVACLQGYLFYNNYCVPAYQATPTWQNVLAASKCMGNRDADANCSS